MEEPCASADASALSHVVQMLAPALSQGRRLDGRLVTGAKRAFFTANDCRSTYVPFPVPSLAGVPLMRRVSCGLALQASPSKEAIACLPLHALKPSELAALTMVFNLVADILYAVVDPRIRYD